MATHSDSVVRFPRATVEIAGLEFSSFTYDITFADLGSGAAHSEAMAGFPTGVFVMGATVEILTVWAGEPDVTVTIGDTADADGLCGSISLDSLAAGTVNGAVGAVQGFQFEADLSTDGLDATFAATELDDVTAGSLRVRIYYATPVVP